MRAPLVSVIIPTFNEENYLPACLQSLVNVDFPAHDLEVIVVDNGSSDRSREIAGSFGAVVLQDNAKNVSGLRNLGAWRAEGEVLAFVDADCVVARDWLKRASDYFEDNSVAAWGAPPGLPTRATWVQEAWFLVRRKEEEVYDTEWLESMNLFVHRPLFKKVGGFNEALITCEDVDLCYRMRSHGRIVADSRIRVVHMGEAATIGGFMKKEIWRGRSNFAGIRSHGLSAKELPSLCIPIYFGGLIPLVLIASAIMASHMWLLVAVLLYALPSVAVLFRIRPKKAGVLAVARLTLVLQCYFWARTFAIFAQTPRRRAEDRVRTTVHNGNGQGGKIKGVLLDVDGTLYYQTPLRVLTLCCIVLQNLHRPRYLRRTLSIIWHYRRAMECLRSDKWDYLKEEKAQTLLTSRLSGEPQDLVAATVKEWYEVKPLAFLSICRVPGLEAVIGEVCRRNLKLGIYSDYPADAKLKALGIERYVSTVVNASDPEVRGFKPNPKGFLVAARRMGLAPEEIIYVGDRPEVDGAGASAAGMPVLILRGSLLPRRAGKYRQIKSLHDLLKLLN